MEMERKGKEEEGYVGYVLCTYRERERELEMCSQVTDCSAPYVLFRSGRYLPGTYLPTTMEWQIHTLGT